MKKSKIMKIDPSRTLMLRRGFIREMNKRFMALRKEVAKLIIQEDAFGLKDSEYKKELRKQGLTILQSFAFQTDPQKIKSFQQWLQQQINLGILKVDGKGKPWTNQYIYSAYRQGALRAFTDSYKSYKVNIPKWFMGNKEQFLLSFFAIPEVTRKIELIFTRAYDQLQGITTSMGYELSRQLAAGLAHGWNPTKIAREIDKSIATISRVRARRIARTEIIYAHSEGQLDAFQELGIDQLNLLVEWSTAGDELVCARCNTRAGETFTIEQARGLIPLHPNCFIDSKVPIYTSKGWKGIGNIEVGDLVLTHKKRFKKVTRLIRNRQKVNVVKLFLENNADRHLRLVMTEEHPVWVENRWVIAKDIKEGMKISYLASRCKRCNKPIPFFRTYCSDSCVSLDVTDKQWSSEEHRKLVSQKASKQMIREYTSGVRDKKKITAKANEVTRKMVKEGTNPFCNPEIRALGLRLCNTPEQRKRCSKRMKLNNPMRNPEIAKKVQESLEKYLTSNPERRINSRMAKLRKKYKMTWIESRMDDLLNKIGIEHIYQYPILRYNVDFAIPALRIVIECDGEYWHKNKRKDLLRQRRITKEGWFVLRYSGKKINQCLDDVKEEIQRVIMNHKKEYEFMDLKVVKIEKREIKTNLYNFSVEDDESYIAKGFVVHNCRCAWTTVEV